MWRELGQFRRQSSSTGFRSPPKRYVNRGLNKGNPMDPSLFQFNATAVFDSPKPGGILQAHASMHFKSRESQWLSRRTRAASLLEIRGTFFGRNRRRESFSTKHAILG